MSDADIEKGSRGLNELTKALSSMKVGVTCLSPDNLETPWLHFEAGALSKAIDDASRLCTYLLDGLEPEDIKPPLGMFQATKSTKEDSRKLVRTINLSVSDDPLDEGDLDVIFDAMWPSLGSTIESLPRIAPAKSVKRKTDDMVAEILEIVRAEANQRKSGMRRMQSVTGGTVGQVESIKAAAARRHRFLSELLERAGRWELAPGEIRIFFDVENRAIAEMLQARDPINVLRAVARKALGAEVDVRVFVEPLF